MPYSFRAFPEDSSVKLEQGNWSGRGEWEALLGDVSRLWPDSVVKTVLFGYYHGEMSQVKDLGKNLL